MRVRALLLIAALFCLGACSNDTETYQKIIGEWTCTSWLAENSTAEKCNNNASFKFNEDKTYSSNLGGVEDKGTYTIERGKLMAKPDGKMVIGVKITQLDEGSMEFLMNNGGTMETLKLQRK